MTAAELLWIAAAFVVVTPLRWLLSRLRWQRSEGRRTEMPTIPPDPAFMPLPLFEALREIGPKLFAGRDLILQAGREDVLLDADPAVQRLITALRGTGPASVQPLVEEHLNALFTDLRDGEDFRHTEAVMAILHALHRTAAPCLASIVGDIAAARLAEIARLSRYAEGIVNRGRLDVSQ